MANTWGEGGGGAAARVNLTPINSSFSDYEAYTYMTSERLSWFSHCMLMKWVPPVIAKSVQCSQVGFACLIAVCHILIVGQLHMLVAAIYSKLSLFIEMRCSIVFTDFTSLLQEHSLQDWGYIIRPIMSTQRKCNRVCAAWWVFPITPVVRWGMPMAAFQHILISQHCNSTLECVYIYFTARECVSNVTTGVREQWWQIVSTQTVSCQWSATK